VWLFPINFSTSPVIKCTILIRSVLHEQKLTACSKATSLYIKDNWWFQRFLSHGRSHERKCIFCRTQRLIYSLIIWSMVKELLQKNKWIGCWRNRSWLTLKHTSRNRLKRMKKKSGIRADNWNQDFPDMKQECQSTVTFSRTTILKHKDLQLIGYACRYSKELRTWPEFDSRRGLAISLFSRVQNGSRVHPASYPMDNWSDFPGGKATGVRRSPLTST
jgi:hypothetical protein